MQRKLELRLVTEYIDEVNTLLEQHDGYRLFDRHWSSDEHDEFCAWYVLMSNGDTYGNRKLGNTYVRAVSTFQI